MSTEVTLPAAASPLALLQSAIDKGVDPDHLGKLMDLAERWEANQARAKFAHALAAFQSECPMVPKTRQVKQANGNVMYRFAGYEDVMAVAGKHLARNGIAVSFSTPEAGEDFVMNCRLQVGAHVEDRPFRGPKPDLKAVAASVGGGGKLTEPQAYGLVLSYYKRYALCAAVGIVICDEDSDCAAPNLPIGEDDQAKILRLIDETESDLDAFLAWCRKASGAEVDSVAEIPQSLMPKALSLLRQKQGERKSGEA